jgi:5-methyltetrahydropteroyltriglutamate--homocysteine methyltransferase
VTADYFESAISGGHRPPLQSETMTTLYRAEQVGSLLRPPDLLHARAEQAAGRLNTDELRAKEDQAILQALERQRQIGLDILSDGEMRRGSWLTSMAEAVEGFIPQRVEVEWHGPGGRREGSTALAVGDKLRKLRKLTGLELPLLKKHAGRPFKITVPAPANFLIASYKPGVTDKFYPAPEDFLVALAGIIRDEIEWLVSEGVTYIQLDAPYYSAYLDPAQRERMQQAGRDPDAELERGIEGDNSCLKGIARDNLTIALHVCRGNSRSRWIAEGGYDAIAERLFGSLDADRFLLEYDSERAGGFEPLRLVPRGKAVVLGLVTTKEPRLESPDDLRRRIDEAARYFPLENLALSPQCGFASVAAGNLLSAEDQWRKLELVVKTARQIWT